MSGPADRLLRLMYEWIEAADECSSKLRALARELESLRQDCNALETVGNTVDLVGALGILASPFTGGASLFVAGTVAGVVGAGVSVVSKIIDHFMSSSKLERVKEIDQKCNKIAEEIQKLFRDLREQCPSSSAAEKDKHAINEFLRAMSRQHGLNVHDLDVVEVLSQSVTVRLASSLFSKVISVLSVFSLCSNSLVLGALCVATLTAAQQFGKSVATKGASKLEGKLLSSATSMGAKQIGKSTAKFLGVVGVACCLSEAINSWEKAIRNKHETEASRSLRDTSKRIDKASSDLSNMLKEITKMLKEAAENHRSSKPSQSTNTSQTTGSKSSTNSTVARGSSSQGKNGGAASGSSDPPRDPDRDRESEEETISEFESSSEVEEVVRMAVQNFQSLFKVLRNTKYSPATVRDLLLRNGLDVLLITETWLKLDSLPPDVVRRLLPDDYSIHHVPRPLDLGKTRGGGVAIIHRNDLACEPVSFQRTWTFEYAAAVVKTPRYKEPLLILNIYRSPEGSVTQFVENFLPEFEALLSEVYKRYKHVVIGGDFNIWVDTLNKKAQTFREIAIGNHLIQHVTRGTHIRGHILDLVLAKSDVRITVVSVDDNDFSDHSTVIFIAKLKIRKNKRKRFKKS